MWKYAGSIHAKSPDYLHGVCWKYAGSIHAKSPDYLHGVWWSLVMGISGLFHVKLKGSYSLTKSSMSICCQTLRIII